MKTIKLTLSEWLVKELRYYEERYQINLGAFITELIKQYLNNKEDFLNIIIPIDDEKAEITVEISKDIITTLQMIENTMSIKSFDIVNTALSLKVPQIITAFENVREFNKANIVKPMIEDEIKDLKEIALFDILEGCYNFSARVKEVGPGMEWYNSESTNRLQPYVFFENVCIQIKGEWQKIKRYGVPIKAKLKDELLKLDLKQGDKVCFRADIEESLIEFLYREGKDEKYLQLVQQLGHDMNAQIGDEPHITLPNDYRGCIAMGYSQILPDEYEETPNRRYCILKQLFRDNFDKKYPTIAKWIATSAMYDEPERRICMYYYNALFTRFYDFVKE